MNKTLSLVLWIMIIQLVGAGLGLLTNISATGWYQALSRSSLTPPDAVFGIVWPLLYVLIAISGWWLWQQPKPYRIEKKLFVAQLILNWLWTPLFFYLHLPGLAFFELLLLTVLTLILIIRLNFKLLLASILLIPYFLWIFFAVYLNYFIWMNN